MWVDNNPDAYAGAVVFLTAEFDCLPLVFNPATPGYWKNHASAWPTLNLQLGDDPTAMFDQACLLSVFSVPTRGDARVKFVHHLIAAKLNLLSGASPSTPVGYPTPSSTIADLVAHADQLLDSSELSCGGLLGPKPGGSARHAFENAKSALDAFNNL